MFHKVISEIAFAERKAKSYAELVDSLNAVIIDPVFHISENAGLEGIAIVFERMQEAYNKQAMALAASIGYTSNAF